MSINIVPVLFLQKQTNQKFKPKELDANNKLNPTLIAKNFGELHHPATSTLITQTLAVQNTWYIFEGFSVIGLSSGITVSLTSKNMTVANAGHYIYNFDADLQSAPTRNLEIAIFVNGSVISRTNRSIRAATNISTSGIILLAANDVVDIRVRQVQVAPSTSLSIYSAGFTLHQ